MIILTKNMNGTERGIYMKIPLTLRGRQKKSIRI